MEEELKEKNMKVAQDSVKEQRREMSERRQKRLERKGENDWNKKRRE